MDYDAAGSGDTGANGRGDLKTTDESAAMTIENFTEMPLRRLESIVKRVKHYSRAYSERGLPGKDGKCFYVAMSDYYEGLFQESMQLSCYPNGGRPLDPNTMYWHVSIIYTETSDEVFDYSKRVSRDNSTAYKSRSPGPEREVKFKLNDDYHFRVFSRTGGGREELLRDLVYLEDRLDRLDMLGKDLVSWATSGAGMMVTCLGKDFPCGVGGVVVSNNVVSAYARDGLTLEEFGRRLVCKECGARKPRLLPRLD